MHISFKKKHSNHTLWERYLAGDKAAFGALYAYYHRSLTAFCIGKMGSIEMAENVASDTLIKLLQYPNPHEIENYENWIFTVAKNECLTSLTKTARRKRLLDENYRTESDQIPDVDRQFSAENIDELIRSNLDDKDYKIWQLHQQGYDNSEIAEIAGINEKTVANRKSASRNKLKTIFKQMINK